MKYFILLATSLIFLGLPACGDESCNDAGTPPVQDTSGQVGDAVSEVSSDALTPDDLSDVGADDAMAEDAASQEDAQEESADAASEEDVQEESADAPTAEDAASSSD